MLNARSRLGVPGLVQAVRDGKVVLANGLGSGIAEARGMLAFLPALSEAINGRPLAMPNIATWWLGEPAALEDAWKRPERLIIKPLERSASERPIVVEDLSEAERKTLREQIEARPQTTSPRNGCMSRRHRCSKARAARRSPRAPWACACSRLRRRAAGGSCPVA